MNFMAMEFGQEFVGLDPATGGYKNFLSKEHWLEYLSMLDGFQTAFEEEIAVCENPWHLMDLQNRMGMEG